MTRLADNAGLPMRLPTELLRKIFRLTVISPNPLRIDAFELVARDKPPEHGEPNESAQAPRNNIGPTFNPPVLRLSRSIYNEQIYHFYKHNTFSLRRSSLCQYHSPLRLSMPLPQRQKLRNILLTSFTGTLACQRLAIGARKPHTNNGPAKSCESCNPNRLPNLNILLPNARLITIDYAAHRDSRIVFEQFCKAVVTGRDNQYLYTIGIGQAVLCNSRTSSTATIVFEDRRLCQIWHTLVAIDPKSLYTRACPEVLAMKHLSLRTTEMILRLLDFYDHECDFLMLAGEASGTRLPDDLRGEQREMSGTFLTAFNWALREYLRIRDTMFVRSLEGGGIRMVMQAQKLQRALLEELDSIPKWSMARDDKKIIKII